MLGSETPLRYHWSVSNLDSEVFVLFCRVQSFDSRLHLAHGRSFGPSSAESVQHQEREESMKWLPTCKTTFDFAVVALIAGVRAVEWVQ